MRYFLNNTEIMAIDIGQEHLVGISWVECESDKNGLPYMYYSNDGKPDYEKITKYSLYTAIEEQVYSYKKFLSDTDYKMTVDYFDILSAIDKETIISQRAIAREYIRDNSNNTI